jgi:hypothetical protein
MAKTQRSSSKLKRVSGRLLPINVVKHGIPGNWNPKHPEPLGDGCNIAAYHIADGLSDD